VALLPGRASVNGCLGQAYVPQPRSCGRPSPAQQSAVEVVGRTDQGWWGQKKWSLLLPVLQLRCNKGVGP